MILRSERRSGGAAAVVLCASVVGLACGAGDDTVVARSVSLTEVFPDTAILRIEEDSADPIGGIGAAVELEGGGLALADDRVPRVRTFDQAGGLVGAFGVQGEGPAELRSIGGLIPNGLGGLTVVDPRLGRVTVLTAGLEVDTTRVVTPRPRGPAIAWGDSVLLMTSSGARASEITLMTDGWSPLWSVPAPRPGTIEEYPYWNSIGRSLFAAAPAVMFTAFSFGYPIHMYDRRGTPVDSLVRPPASFRSATVLEPGEFAGPGAEGRFREWIGSFDVVADLSVVNDTLLVVSHGELRGELGAALSATAHHVAVYHVPSRTKLYEDLVLPDDAEVLTGGDALYVLTQQPPGPWTILRVEMDTPSIPGG